MRVGPIAFSDYILNTGPITKCSPDQLSCDLKWAGPCGMRGEIRRVKCAGRTHGPLKNRTHGLMLSACLGII
jgi:hypothetical protein